jgi:hypothetical protein
VSRLSLKRQAQIYKQIRALTTVRPKPKAARVSRKDSVFGLFGTAVSSVTDGAANHDKYLNE